MFVLSLAVCVMPRAASAQTVTCRPKEFRASLVRIEKPPQAPGTGIVIIRREQFAVILTAKHVVAFDPDADFTVYFQVAPTRRVPVRWNGNSIVAYSPDSEVVAFRVDAQIPKDVVPEDPFIRDVPDGATMVSWGYPAADGGTLCVYESTLRTTAGGQLVVNGAVPAGLSGGPTFFVDPDDRTPKLAGIVVSGDGDLKRGTTQAIDIRQAVTIVSTSRDPRTAKPIIWPNIPLPASVVIDPLSSFQKVDAGSFVMGSTRQADEKPVQTRDLPVFYMGRYEVTVAQYRECVMARVCSHTDLNINPNDVDLPVVNVTWRDATAYARWLQQQLMTRPTSPIELRRLLLAGWQIDLPSEEEWERAARKNGTDVYPWGGSANPRYANYNTGKLRPVNSSKCDGCEWGLFDMAGNAREWTRSLKLPYPYNAAKAEDPTAPGNRVIRGGSFKRVEQGPLAAQIVRSPNRQDEAPSKSDLYTGFRLALICKRERKCNWQEPD